MNQLLPFFQSHPYSSLLVMIFVEELGIFLPFPGDAALVLFGVWSRQGLVNFLPTLLVVCLATALASSILFFVSRWLGKLLLSRYHKWLSYAHITQKNIDMVERWMAKYGGITLVVCRLTPGLRIVGTVAAGVLDVPYRVFISATMIGTVLWVAIYYSLGSLLGRRFADQIESVLNNRSHFVLLILIGAAAWLVLFKLVIPLLKKHAKDKPQ